MKPTSASIKTLHSDPDNPRQITSEGLDGLGASTRKFGDLSGIVFNKRSNCLVAGHQRVKVLRRAGAKDWVTEKECTTESEGAGYIEDPRSGARFRIRIVDWDETMERAANLAANNPEIQGEYTAEAIGQLQALESDLEEFDELRFGDLAASLEKELGRELKKAQKDAEEAEDESKKIGDDFAIIIECNGEEQQVELLERLQAEGLKCRALI